MKFIEDKVWTEILNYFYKKQYGSIKGNIKGVQFEALVAFLLKLLFNQYEIEFHPTKASHDGSKDFWAIDDLQELWWAECKNYTQNIALKELAPTLVMAELNDVQHLLFFSYSNLNKNLKRHIGRYAFEHKKEVFIYENETIEELLFTNYKEMLSDFLGQQIKADFHHSVEIDFYKLLNKKEFAFEELHRYLKIIFGKLSQGRYAVIIDNMQSYAVEIIDFFKEMIQYMLQHQQSSHIVLLISINTSLVFDDRYLDFIGEFSRIDFLCRKIDGFQNEKQAIAYLKTILSLDDYPLNLPVLRKILASTSLKPKYIQQLANHLIISDCIEFKNQHGIINKSKELEASLRSIPDDYERLFSSSYHMILDKYVQWKSDIYDFISLLHLFSTMDESLLDILNVDRKIVQALVRHGVIKNEGDHRNKCYAFEHDLIESCLSTDIYPDLLKNAMKYLESYQDLFHTILRDKQVPILLYKLSHRMYAGSELITINKHKVLYTIPNKFIFKLYMSF